MRPLALALAPTVLCALAAPASADSAQAKVGATSTGVDLIGAISTGGKLPAFIGRGGQIFSPTENGAWRRAHLGGVAANLRAAIRIDNDIVGAGDSAPLYRFADGVWSAEAIPARGGVVLADDGSAPTLAINNRVYIHNGMRWIKRFRADSDITAVWASSPRRIYFATDAGLGRARGRDVRPISCNGDCTNIHELCGVPGRGLYAVTDDGRLFHVSSSAAREVVPAGELSGFTITAGRGLDRRVLLAGVIESEGQLRGLLVAGKGSRLTAVAMLGPLAADDHPVAIAGTTDGGILVATRRGQVFHVSGSEVTAKGRVSDALPKSPTRDPGKAPATAQ